MSLWGLTILRKRLSTTKTDTVLFFWSCLTSHKLNISPFFCISLDTAFAYGRRSSTSTSILSGALHTLLSISLEVDIFGVGSSTIQVILFGGSHILFCENINNFRWRLINIKEDKILQGGTFFEWGEHDFYFMFFFLPLRRGRPSLARGRVKKALMAEPPGRLVIRGG